MEADASEGVQDEEGSNWNGSDGTVRRNGDGGNKDKDNNYKNGANDTEGKKMLKV